AKSLDDFVAIWRGDDVCDEGFGAEMPDADFAYSGQRMIGGNHEGELILINHDRVQAIVLRIVGEHAHFDRVVHDVVGNVAAERALHHNLDHRMQAAEFA